MALKTLNRKRRKRRRKCSGENGDRELVIENLSFVIGARKGGKERETGSVVHKMREKKKIVLIV
jgi:hypothetical protein